ncbi:hypothetical protein BJ166DRAFT_590356 [Pestalotiopsis sp. NC0098]|nr:hypothetical protein BJ166DRAFT_590356 [Pestalotiopsis sp. NC0098]
MDASDTPEDLTEGAGVPQEVESASAADNEVEVSDKIQENQTESTKAESIVVGDDEKDQDAEISSAGSSREPEVDVPSSESDSSSDSEEDGSASPSFMQDLKSDVAKHFTSKTFFDAYTQRLEKRGKKKTRNDQAPMLVKGVVDYMRTLEERISSLEKSQDVESEAETDSDSVATAEIRQSEVHLDVKFFNAAAYPGQAGPFALHEGGKGTFACSYDEQNFIRALYCKHTESKSKPQRQADTVAPNAREISVLVVDVFSRAITSFFAIVLGVGVGDSIKFGRPFRTIIRNIGRIRDHLIKLEGLHGEVGSVISSGSRRNSDHRSQPTEVQTNHESHEGADLRDENVQTYSPRAYDQPAALPHFRLFMDFVTNYLGEEIALYDRLRNGEEQQIAFEDLWMLFDQGDTIYCPVRPSTGEKYQRMGTDQPHVPVTRYTPQAYRVLATDGGMHHRSTMMRSNKWSEAKDGLGTTTFSAAVVEAGDTADKTTVTEMLTQPANLTRKPYERKMDIRSLQAYPVAYAPVTDLLTRGREFLKATKVSHLQYEGLTVGPLREDINSPVVVDIRLAYEGGRDIDEALIKVPAMSSGVSGPGPPVWMINFFAACPNVFTKMNSCGQIWCTSPHCVHEEWDRGRDEKAFKILSDVDLVLEEYETEILRGSAGLAQFSYLMAERNIIELLPGMVPGFALRNRKWVLLNISQLKPVEQNNEWDNLVLPPGHREMVQAMVETHTRDMQSGRDSRPGMDLVKGKGRGCIILLHGVPGVGKTSTAECVATHTKKPLYPITCGDVGYKAEDVERNMESHFKLAHRWGCVLLLDEADVFLARRDQKDVQRNGLVSVFLRILEYYSGILFLTTNRVGDIDEAFRSRLHLSLYYPKLKRKQTKQIFRRNFERINEMNDERTKHGLPPFIYKDAEPKIMLWAEETYKTLQWNGRQIRNTFQTVLALAEFHAKQRDGDAYSPKVTKKQFKVVADAAILFNQYLAATHGADQDKMATRSFIRASTSFEPSQEHRFTGLEEDTSESSSQEDDSSSNDSDSDSDESDSSDRAGGGKKKSSSAKKSKASKNSSSKKRKASAKEKKSEKKSKDKKKKENKEESDDSD